MDYFFRFAYSKIALGAIFLIIAAAIVRHFFYKPTSYWFSLSGPYFSDTDKTYPYVLYIPYSIRLTILILLGLLIGRPQLVDVKSKIHAQGIDIMLVLDASGSMEAFDDLKDRRSRFAVAKSEAIEFIKNRHDDQIGLILFGRDAMSRCPLTLDTKVLESIIENLQLGDIDLDGTVLSTAIAMGVQRLRKSNAKSKVLIVLTDGDPSVGLDINHTVAIDLAKKCGVKIYTIGVGGEHGALAEHPLFGVQAFQTPLNIPLLKEFAAETGGKFFRAKNPQDLKRIYETIDMLERTEYETSIFSNYYELVVPWVAVILALICIELIMTTFVWFVV